MNVHRIHVKFPSVLSYSVLMKLNRQIFENIQIQNLIKIRPVGVKLFHVDRKRQTDGLIDRHDQVNSLLLPIALRPFQFGLGFLKSIVAFRNSAN